MIKPQFSFLYDGKPYDGNGAIKTTLEVKKHEKYDAVEWVVWYENTSKENSGILSEIKITVQDLARTLSEKGTEVASNG